MTERLWFKIGETARQVGATPKELRYWEKVIPELRPRRSRGNLRYYHADELPRLCALRAWLAEGLTVADCRERLKLEPAPPSREQKATPHGPTAPPAALAAIAEALRALLARLGGGPEAMPSRRARKPRPLPPAPEPMAEPTPEPAGMVPPPEAPAPLPEEPVCDSPPEPQWTDGRLPLDLEDDTPASRP